MNYRLTFYVLVAVALLHSHAAFAPPPVPLETTEEQLLFLQAILARHPGIVLENIQFRRNLLDFIADIPRARAALGDNAQAMELGDTTMFSGIFSGTAASYDATAISRVRTTLTESVNALQNALPEFRSISQDIGTLNGLPNGQREAAFRAYFRVLPLIYSAEGQATIATPGALQTHIESISAGQIDNAYRDLYRGQLEGRVRELLGAQNLSHVLPWFNSTNSQFVQNTVLPSLVLRTEGGQNASTSRISVERVPASVALLIRNFGRDCGLYTVPFFPLLRRTQVYLIRNSSDPAAPPRGYIFVADVPHNGGTLPYIITANGHSLSDADYRAAFRLIAQEKGVSQVVLPDIAAHPGLANTPEARRALGAGTRTAAQVTLPGGWDTLTQNQFRYAPYNTEQHNYYNAQGLRDAFVVPVDTLGIHFAEQPRQTTITNPYSPQAQRLGQISLLERALLSVHALHNVTDRERRQRVLSLLQVNSAQHEAALHVANATADKPLTLEQFQTAHSQIGFRLDDILKLDILTRVQTLSYLYNRTPGLTSRTDWSRLFQAATRALDRELLQRNPDGTETMVVPDQDALKAWMKAQNGVPSEFRSAIFNNMTFWRAMVSWLRNEAIHGGQSFMETIFSGYPSLTELMPASLQLELLQLVREPESVNHKRRFERALIYAYGHNTPAEVTHYFESVAFWRDIVSSLRSEAFPSQGQSFTEELLRGHSPISRLMPASVQLELLQLVREPESANHKRRFERTLISAAGHNTPPEVIHHFESIAGNDEYHHGEVFFWALARATNNPEAAYQSLWRQMTSSNSNMVRDSLRPMTVLLINHPSIARDHGTDLRNRFREILNETSSQLSKVRSLKGLTELAAHSPLVEADFQAIEHAVSSSSRDSLGDVLERLQRLSERQVLPNRLLAAIQTQLANETDRCWFDNQVKPIIEIAKRQEIPEGLALWVIRGLVEKHETRLAVEFVNRGRGVASHLQHYNGGLFLLPGQFQYNDIVRLLENENICVRAMSLINSTSPQTPR